jgi:hypothetical protein
MTHEEAAILLGGWNAGPPGETRHGFAYLRAWLWDGDERMASAWRQHETYLRALAVTWGWAPECWIAPPNEHGLRFVMNGQGTENHGPCFYAEALALAGPQRVGG